MNTGAEDDSLSTPTFAFSAVCALALFISAALTSANTQRLRTALAIVIINIVFSNGCVVTHSCHKIARHSGARVKRASPESITTVVSMDSGPARQAGASRNDE